MHPTKSPGARLRQAMQTGVVSAAGAFVPFVARLVEEAGFEAVYVSGAALSNSLARPDEGVIPRSRVLEFTREIVEVVGIPVTDAHVPYLKAFADRLRRLIRERVPDLALGGWANPHRDAAEQVRFLLNPESTAEFYLTQVVSHHSIRAVEAFVTEARRREVPRPRRCGRRHHPQTGGFICE